VGAGAGNCDPRVPARLVDTRHEFAGKVHVVHRFRRFGNHDQDPAVPGKKVGGVGVEVQRLTSCLQAGQHQVPEREGVGSGKIAHAHAHLACQFCLGTQQGLLNRVRGQPLRE